ncbi:amino acid adenylation domain-containing protein [Chitinophaga varians]|uniref:Amino acid adenylation domain-containing protein n=1 Tax=Chitinophaga varians TaxID=2202339 RepID=A0A847RYA3_9BACT|nr:non-ribosomal peptide synthetase [Chitinophaga varians]NLR68042.1 amino acid adenylation domain-containing protein [Chitinophaga varians]
MTFQSELISSLRGHADKTAVEYGSRHVSYAELLTGANSITSFLTGMELGKEARIAVYFSDRADLITAIIGIANAGCVFVPVDLSLPANRLATILEELAPAVFLTSRCSPHINKLHDAHVSICYVEDAAASPQQADMVAGIYPAWDEQDSLYIYFTSGSTGRPKGIIGRNGSLLQFLKWETETFCIDTGCRCSQFISPYFDAFLRDIFAPLLQGGTICVPPDDETFLTPDRITEWIDREGITLVHCVPSLFRLINNDRLTTQHFSKLKHVLLSGEKVIPSELAPWYAVFGERIQLVNLYGPTECTMVRVFHRITPADISKARIPIGEPIADTRLMICDDAGQPCGPMIPGELYIITNYATKGYLNDTEMTRERFVRIHDEVLGDTIAFRTGDIARFLVNKKVDLIGRADRQMKVNGIRIEPDEIEQQLIASGIVKSALVTDRGENGNTSLMAFVVLQETYKNHPDALTRILEHLHANLPAYMIPPVVEKVDRFPLLSNGKIDYNKLKSQVGNRQRPIVAPTDHTEVSLLGIWKEILGDRPISTDDSFHHAGGNSLAVMKLIGRIYNEFQVRFSLQALFDNLTIKKQAALIRQSARETFYTITPAVPKAAYHVTAVQERMYYDYAKDRNSTAYNMPVAWEIAGEVHRDKIETAVQALLRRHESLRTAFRFVDNRLMQVIQEDINFSLEAINCDPHAITGAIASFVRSFDLECAPLLRCMLITVNDGRSILVMDIHHIICDGISQQVLYTDFIKLYQGKMLPPLAIQYKDYAEWEWNFRMTEEYLANREFWLKILEREVPVLHLPVSRGTGELPDQAGQVTVAVSKQLLAPLIKDLSEKEVTIAPVLLSVYFLFLSQITGQEDIVVGVAASGRTQYELENVVGMFVKTLPVRSLVRPDQKVTDFIYDLHRHLVQAGDRQMYDLSDIQHVLNRRGGQQERELFRTMFVFQNFERGHLEATGSPFRLYEVEHASPAYPLTLISFEDDTAFYFRLEFSRQYFTPEDARLLASRFVELTQKLARHSRGAIADVIDDSSIAPVTAGEEISFNF